MAKPESLGRSSGKIGAATAASRVTGLLRETLFAYLLGSGPTADAYFAATRIPNLLRDLFAEGALGAAFVPVLSEKLAKHDSEAAFGVVRRMMTAMALIVGFAVALGIILAPYLVKGLAPGFAATPGKIELTTQLVRWTFPYLWLISLSALVAGTLNSLRRFGVPASAPILFNVGHIGTAIIFYAVFDPPVVALALGVTVGAAAQLLFQWPALRRAGFRFRFSAPWKDPDVKRVFKLMLPVTIGLAALQLNNLATTIIASFLPDGSLSYLNYSFRLMHFPLGVVAVAVGTAILPRASTAVVKNDRAGLLQIYNEGLTTATMLVVPAAMFLVLFSELIVAAVYQRGAFLAADSIQTASALRMYALGLLGYAGVRVTAPLFYAHKNTRTPMRFALIAVVVNVVGNLALAKPLGFAGLALANAVAGSLNYLMLRRQLKLMYGMLQSAESLKGASYALLDCSLAGGLIYMIMWIYGTDVTALDPVSRLGLCALIGVVFFSAALWRVFLPHSIQRRTMARILGRQEPVERVRD